MTSPQNTASSRAVAPVIPSQDIPMTGAPIPAAGLSREYLSASQAGVIAPVESAVSVPKHCEATTPASGGVGGFFDGLEAFTNALIGLAVSWSATFWLLPLWGLHPSAGQSAGITAMFFCVSFGRSYALRRIFRRLA